MVANHGVSCSILTLILFLRLQNTVSSPGCLPIILRIESNKQRRSEVTEGSWQGCQGYFL